MKDNRIWRTSSYSGGQGNCVEVTTTVPSTVSVRDSKDRNAGELTFTSQAWEAFIAAVKEGGLVK